MLVDASKFPGPALFQGLALIGLAGWMFWMSYKAKKDDAKRRKRMRDLWDKEQKEVDEIMAKFYPKSSKERKIYTLEDITKKDKDETSTKE